MGCGRANLISENITKLLNEQINKEFYSAYLYLSMSAYFCKIGLYGFAHWTKIQAKEEVDHGMILFEYILTQDSTVELKQIEMPRVEFLSPLQVFEKIYEHEKSITKAIENIIHNTENDCDISTTNFLDWYIKEQVEEESNVRKVITRLNTFADCALYMMDKELSQREYSPIEYSSI